MNAERSSQNHCPYSTTDIKDYTYKLPNPLILRIADRIVCKIEGND